MWTAWNAVGASSVDETSACLFGIRCLWESGDRGAVVLGVLRSLPAVRGEISVKLQVFTMPMAISRGRPGLILKRAPNGWNLPLRYTCDC